MAEPGIKEFHKFINEGLREEILKRYLNFIILSEADLQSHMYQLLSNYLKEHESKTGLHKVLNKPYLKEINIHPDIIVFRRNKPWVVMELKEGKKLKELAASRDFRRLVKVREHFKQKRYAIRRGYLFHVSRYSSDNIIKTSDSKLPRFLYEVSVTLGKILSYEEMKAWEAEFKKWAKYISNPSKIANKKDTR